MNDPRGTDAFADWLAREMPPGTVISNPRWWAPRIAAAYERTRWACCCTAASSRVCAYDTGSLHLKDCPCPCHRGETP